MKELIATTKIELSKYVRRIEMAAFWVGDER